MEDKTLTLEDFLREQKENFSKQLIANLLDLKREEVIMVEDPTYIRTDQQGRTMKIAELIEMHRDGVKNCKSFLAIIADVENAIKKGTFDEMIGDEYLASVLVDSVIPQKSE